MAAVPRKLADDLQIFTVLYRVALVFLVNSSYVSLISIKSY